MAMNVQGRLFKPYFIDHRGIDENFLEMYKERLGKMKCCNGDAHVLSFCQLFDMFDK